jgi:hypothetical protein
MRLGPGCRTLKFPAMKTLRRHRVEGARKARRRRQAACGGPRGAAGFQGVATLRAKTCCTSGAAVRCARTRGDAGAAGKARANGPQPPQQSCWSCDADGSPCVLPRSSAISSLAPDGEQTSCSKLPCLALAANETAGAPASTAINKAESQRRNNCMRTSLSAGRIRAASSRLQRRSAVSKPYRLPLAQQVRRFVRMRQVFPGKSIFLAWHQGHNIGDVPG